jgi:hypothetical protein
MCGHHLELPLRAMRMLIAFLLLISFKELGSAEPCNPAIDGTYCASAPKPLPRAASSTDKRFESLGASLSASQYDQPATLGTITFRGDGTRCIGLLRRGGCQ